MQTIRINSTKYIPCYTYCNDPTANDPFDVLWQQQKKKVGVNNKSQRNAGSKMI